MKHAGFIPRGLHRRGNTAEGCETAAFTPSPMIYVNTSGKIHGSPRGWPDRSARLGPSRTILRGRRKKCASDLA